MAILPASDASGPSSSLFSSHIEVPKVMAKVRQKKWFGDAFFGVEWTFRGSSVAEDVGDSDAPTVAQLRRCTSATHRAFAPKAPAALHHTHQHEARPHTAHRIARQRALSPSRQQGEKRGSAGSLPWSLTPYRPRRDPTSSSHLPSHVESAPTS
ncbi:uncharacterized protein CCOS01_08180 [Colletotrichum costaricense]|uniref:Uncharacterized protein n=1 Tax=Colletotrichum costaricense TaxID=1209916 RepID=A0AAJ0E0H6_9PEZI|nr:uncharacterized protein CCOS01_08180 [Colletotrichum costaricense]KAK1525762.1 hypothetical protein CCOS01_08180 [Colletotrichum costaricense]